MPSEQRHARWSDDGGEPGGVKEVENSSQEVIALELLCMYINIGFIRAVKHIIYIYLNMCEFFFPNGGPPVCALSMFLH